MSKIQDLRGQLDADRKKLAGIFEEAGDDYDMDNVKSLDGDSAAKAAEIKRLNDNMSDLGKQIDEHETYASMKAQNDKLSEVQAHPGHQTNGKQLEKRQGVERKTAGELFTDSIAYKERMSGGRGPVATLDYDVKALFSSDASWVPDAFFSPRLVDYPTRPLMVADLLPQSAITASAVRYFVESSWTNAAVEVGEGTAKPEATLAITTRTDPVQKIAVWIPVTDEQLADVPQVQGYLTSRLGFMVRQRLDLQALVGNGTDPNISGILDRTGIQTQAKGADATPDAFYKAMTKVRVNAFLEPDGIVMHPNDWQAVRLLTTADGIYLWGPPMDAGPERLWGVRVVVTTAMTENTGLVGAFNMTTLYMRNGLEIRVTDSHSDYFIKNIQVILAEIRAALAVYREDGFCTVTGI